MSEHALYEELYEQVFRRYYRDVSPLHDRLMTLTDRPAKH
jgi:hypothetical protein